METGNTGTDESINESKEQPKITLFDALDEQRSLDGFNSESFEYVTGIHLALKGLSEVHPDPAGLQFLGNEKANSEIEKAINYIEVQEAQQNGLAKNITVVKTTEIENSQMASTTQYLPPGTQQRN